MRVLEGSIRRRSAKAALAASTALAAVTGVAHAQLPPPPEPAGNPVTAAKANLGKVLFWDEQISSTRTVACGTCHIPVAGGSDPRSAVDPLSAHPGPDGVFGGEDDVLGSLGVPVNQADGLYGWSNHFGMLAQVTPRRTPSSINAGYAPELFWDGRAPEEFVDPVTQQVVLPTGGALESQSVGPPVSDVEMANVARAWTDVLARISASAPLALAPDVPSGLRQWIDDRSYPELFEEAFGTPAITAARVAMAIASYERTQFTNQSPFDQFLATGTGLTPQELDGRTVFASVGQCDACHQGALMTDPVQPFRYIGVRPRSDDPGRMEVTSDPVDEGRMKVPSLRNVELRSPFMHNGRFETLEEVIEFYDRGGDFCQPGTGQCAVDNELPEIDLDAQQKADLLAFITRPLTDPRLEQGLPPFDRPALYTESTRVPAVLGSGLPGSGGLEPAVVALEPPLIGNPSFTVGVWNGLGGADALLVIDDQDPGLTVPGSGEFAFESIVLDGDGAGKGFGSVSLAIPNDPALAGQDWFGRWYVTDGGGGSTHAVSRLFRFRTFLSTAGLTIFEAGFETGDTSVWSAALP